MFSTSNDARVQASVPQPWIARISRPHKVLINFAVAAFVFVGGGALDWLVSHQYLPSISLMLAGAAVASAIGLLVFKAITEVHK